MIYPPGEYPDFSEPEDNIPDAMADDPARRPLADWTDFISARTGLDQGWRFIHDPHSGGPGSIAVVFYALGERITGWPTFDIGVAERLANDILAECEIARKFADGEPREESSNELHNRTTDRSGGRH